MIVFEEQLARLVDVLPPFVGADLVEFPINYNWGTIETLNKYLSLSIEKTPYPLIWLANGKDTHDLREPSVTRNARIIIATRSLNVDELNPYQYQNDFKVILQPVLDNLLLALKLGGISRYNDVDLEIERVPNYAINEITNQIDVWNAIVLDAEITFSGVSTCVKEINFNN